MALLTYTERNGGCTGPIIPAATSAMVAGATAQTILLENAGRRLFFFQNVSAEDIWVNFGVVAVADAPSIKVPTMTSLVFSGSAVPGDFVSIIAATTGSKYTCKEI